MEIAPGSALPWFPLPPGWRRFAAATPGAILLETASGNTADHTSLLFASPVALLRADTPADLPALLAAVDAALANGHHLAGYLTYEAGAALHAIAPRTDAARPLALLGVYPAPQRFDHHTGVATGPTHAPADPAPPTLPNHALLGPLLPALSADEYAPLFAAVQQHLAAGDTYQVNLTTSLQAELRGSPSDLYDLLIAHQPVDFAAILHLDADPIVSFSPELFFRIDPPDPSGARRIHTRPMKGTAARGNTPAEDAAARAALLADTKTLAEHVMIVDLLRNDLGRIARVGSVHVDKLFAIESYPTLHQMTSSISATLADTADGHNTPLSAVLAALFPCGSVTGAPKRSTMGIIRQLEPAARGVYTGAILHAAPDGSACASVPIRTLTLTRTGVTMGTGGGIVADSTAPAEYDECLLKAAFLAPATYPPQLIETLLWDGVTFPLLRGHLDRLTRSAAALSYHCEPAHIASALHERLKAHTTPRRVRLLLDPGGAVTLDHAALTGPTTGLRIRLSRHRVHSDDAALRHKTTHRAVYNREFARAQADGFDEVLFLNQRGEFAEGAISTFFLEIGGTLHTPPLRCGALPGVLRAHLLQTVATIHGNVLPVAERVLTVHDLRLAANAYLGNALRGLRRAAFISAE